MNKNSIKILDRLFQETLLKENPASLLGGIATEIHHFYGRVNMSIRWWRENGIPLTHEQHLAIESKDGKALKTEIIRIKGKEWHKRLTIRKNLICKPSFQKVKDYLENKKTDYLTAD